MLNPYLRKADATLSSLERQTNLLQNQLKVKDIDGNIYNTVLIGKQVWMKENLRVSHYQNGDIIPFENDGNVWLSATSGLRTWFNHDSILYEKPYGNLYNWYAATDNRGICPQGFRLPTSDDWIELRNEIGGRLNGGKLIANTTAGATNETGYSSQGVYFYNTFTAGPTWYYWSKEAINLDTIFPQLNAGECCAKSVIFLNIKINNIGGPIFNITSNNSQLTKNVGAHIRCIKDNQINYDALLDSYYIPDDLFAPINNPAFTGTVSGIDKNMVGLGNADNTSDADKPVSTATQTVLNNKLNISDTSTMLTNYRNGLNNKLNATDTSLLNLTNRYSSKVNVSDTSNMLSNYRTGLNQKVNNTDFQTGINAKVNIVDTASMLDNYLRSGIAASTYQTKLINPIVAADTANMLSNYRTDLNNKLNILDTTILSNRINTKLNISDFPLGTTPGNMQYWNGTTWVNLEPGLPGQILSIDNSSKPVWLSTLPVISTNSVSDINPNVATCGGNITSVGGSPVTERGIVWSINPNPTISLSTKTNNGLGAGAFTSSMTGLTSNVVYYVRAYVTNSVGTSYGNEVVFTTTANIPILSTTSVQSITTNGAISGGNISSDGGSPITVRGTVWSTSANPTVALSTKTSDGSGLGTFNSNITGLNPNTTYYIRSYATNTAGTGYGNEFSFNTLIGAIPPTLTTNAATEISYTTFTTGGNISFEGGASVTARGIIWSQTQIPTISLPTKTVNGSGNGSFTSYMFDLIPNTVYYVRSYATNNAGTGYGVTDTVQTRAWVNCPSNVSDIDNNVYNVVTIGFQCWTNENMKVSKYSNGDEIPIIINGVTWASLTTGLRCWYLNDSVTYENPYGNLYNWYAASDFRGICPTGWHVPTDAEFTELTTYLGGEGVAGGKMKATGSAYEEGNIGASNSSGFNGFGGGFREGIQEPGYLDGQFGRIKLDGRFWSSSSFNNSLAWSQSLIYYGQIIFRGGEKKGKGFSVRCLRD